MGSGHILVYAFDVLYDIYLSQGYSERQIPSLLLEKNLYGLEIDDRAGQLASFALLMKARSKNRRIFRQTPKLNLCSIQESNGIVGSGQWTVDSNEAVGSGQLIVDSERLVEYFVQGVTGEERVKLKADLEYLIDVFHDAKEYGSILEVKEIGFDALEERLEEIRNDTPSNIIEHQYKDVLLEKVPPLLKQGRIMSQKYDVVCTNPPYMGRRGMSSKLAEFLGEKFPDTKSDLFAVFIEKGFTFLKKNGFNAMVTMQSWMFLSSYEKMRKKILDHYYISSLVHMENMVMGIAFGTSATLFRNSNINGYKGTYFLVGLNDIDKKSNEPIDFPSRKRLSRIKTSDFSKIPGSPIAYWASDNVRNVFERKKMLSQIAKIGQGLKTGDNNSFLRMWFEVKNTNIAFTCKSRIESQDLNQKWYPYTNGGEYRKWYGNFEDVVNWKNDGFEIRNFYDDNNRLRSRLQNMSYYFKSGLTWSALTSKDLSIRFVPDSIIYGGAGYGVFSSRNSLYYLLALLNTKIPSQLVKCLSETMNFEVGVLGRIPIINRFTVQIENLTKQNISLSRADWDSFETSWDFQRHPFLTHKNNAATIEKAFHNWSAFAAAQFNQLKQNEEELNRIFIDIYGLQDELTPEVEDEDVTISKADRERDIKSFISYAVGCMFGRYSMDREGLIYAGGEFGEKFRLNNGTWELNEDDRWIQSSIHIAADNIIPIADGDYFEDDILERFTEFVRVSFGEETLEENLNYIAETLGLRAGETPRQAIRRYFLRDFYKDHVRTYKKRPIYWLFDSGRENGFKALIYMHRYDPYIVARVRTDYLHKLQKKYEAEMNC